jgi:hypothetical protein
VIEISTAMSADGAKKLLAKDVTNKLATSETGLEIEINEI